MFDIQCLMSEWHDKGAILPSGLKHVLKQGMKILGVSVNWKWDRLVTYWLALVYFLFTRQLTWNTMSYLLWKIYKNKRSKMALYHSPDYQINWTFRSREVVQNRFPRQRPWRQLGFLIVTISALFNLQVNQMLPTQFGVRWPFNSWEEAKKYFFFKWWPAWISNQNDFKYFVLLVTPILPIKFQDNRPFVSGEEANRFSRWRPSWISDRNDFSYI